MKPAAAILLVLLSLLVFLPDARSAPDIETFDLSGLPPGKVHCSVLVREALRLCLVDRGAKAR